MKIRYISQKDEYNCGPTAIINLLKWQGFYASWKTIYDLRVLMWGSKEREKAMRGFGTPTFILDGLISNYKHISNTLVCKKDKPTIKDLKKYLAKDKAILLDFFWNTTESGHYTLIIGYSNTKFTVVNFKQGNTIQYIKEKEIQKLLKIRRKEPGLTKYSCMWVFSKK